MRKLGDQLLEAKTEGDTTLLATKDDKQVSVLLARAAENFDKSLPDEDRTLVFHGVSAPCTATVYRIDSKHCDPYGEFCRKEYTEPLTQEQIQHLQQIGCLKVAETIPVTPVDGTATLTLNIPGDSLTLVQI